MEEVKRDNTTLWEELIFLKDEMKEAKIFMQEKEAETQELTRNCNIMSRELLLSKLSYANDFTNFEKQTTVFLLNGQTGEKELESKFKVLKELLKVRRHILEILGTKKEL